MSARGVRFLFSPGEAVLCFEPDPTKARVLYDAKVLDTNVGKDKTGRRVAEYQIHFQGWNSSWDRIVPEDFVLKSTEEHKNLMKRITKIARKVKRNKMRKKKIDKILDHVLRRSRRGGGEGSGGEEESDLSEDKDCESEEEEDSDSGSTGDDDSDGRLGARGPGSDQSDGEASSSAEQESSEDEEEEIDLDRIPELRLEIPEELKKRLEDDCYFVLRKNKLVHLPADPNIITILEGYVKSFAINILCASTEKVRVRGEQQQTPPERNIELCKEVVDGLRLMFDFILPTHLLYNVEKVHHTNLLTSFKPPLVEKSESSETESADPPIPMSPRGRTTRQSVTSPTTSHEPPTKIPRLSPKLIKKEPIEDDDEVATPRRMTRQALAEAERGKSFDQPPVMEKSPVLETKEAKQEMTAKERRRSVAESRKVRRASRRSSARLNSSGSQASNSKSSSESRTLSQRITPPPPLLLPSVMSSMASSPRVTPTLKSVNTGTTASRTNFGPPENGAQLNGILSWKLIPLEVYAETPPPPSVIYGVHHLLRLFVKLPEFVNSMAMPHNKRLVLQKHLDMILEYLEENNELFPESAYVDAPTSSPTKPDGRRR